jgi:hypothetical protein
MNIDAGILTGVTGAILATISLVYARSQTHAQRRQVEEMPRQTDETRRAQHFETSHALMKDAIAARQDWAFAFPKKMGAAHHRNCARRDADPVRRELGPALPPARLRRAVSGDVLARKADLVADDHWRAMHWFVRSFFCVANRLHHLRELYRDGLGDPGIRKVWARVRCQWYLERSARRLEAIQGRSLTSGDQVSSSD